MEKISSIRKGKTIRVRWTVTADVALTKDKLTLEMIDSVGRVTTIPADKWSFENNTVEYTHEGVEQRHVGKYGFTLWYNKGEQTQTVVDKTTAYILVNRTECEHPQHRDNLELTTVDLGSSEFNAVPVISGGGGDDCVKYIDLLKLPEDGTFHCDGAFEVGLGIEEEDDEGVMHRIFHQASHKRLDVEAFCRYDCIIHSAFYDTALGAQHLQFSIIRLMENGNNQCLGFLSHLPRIIAGGEILYENKLISIDETELPEIAGSTADEYAERILPMFGEGGGINPIGPAEYVQVVDLTDKKTGSFAMNRSPFFCKYDFGSIPDLESRYFSSSHFRIDEYRGYVYHCFVHAEKPYFLNSYSIIKNVEGDGNLAVYRFLGFLVYAPTGGTSSSSTYRLIGTGGEALETIDDKTVGVWKNIILPLFGEGEDNSVYKIPSLIHHSSPEVLTIPADYARVIYTEAPLAIKFDNNYSHYTLYRTRIGVNKQGVTELVYEIHGADLSAVARLTCTDEEGYDGRIVLDVSLINIVSKLVEAYEKVDGLVKSLAILYDDVSGLQKRVKALEDKQV